MNLSVLQGDWIERLRELDHNSIQCCVTSPPYWGLRDYGIDGQLGLEKSPEDYVKKIVVGFSEVRRVLKNDGTLWLNLGDSYCAPNGRSAGGAYSRGPNSQLKHMHGAQEFGIARGFGDTKPKDLVGIPWMVAFALRADGWYLRSDIIWSKPNPMPESVTDRPTRAHEYIFLLSKSSKYYYDHEAIKEPPKESSLKRISQPSFDEQAGGAKDPLNGNRSHRKTLTNWKDRIEKQRGHSRRHAGFNARWDGMTTEEQGACGRNKRSVWTVPPANYPESHFATFPPKLIEPCILAGSRVGDTILDPFGGSGTTGEVAITHGRKATLIELNPDYVKLIEQRCNITPGLPLS